MTKIIGLITPSTGEDVEELESANPADGNIKMV